jgi:predicted metal-binding membrane protein
MAAAIEAMLARHRAVTIAMLAVLTLLAWIWLALGAGTGMVPGLSLPALVPHGAAPSMPGMDMGAVPHNPSMSDVPGWQDAGWWSVSRFALTFSMWWVMMVAMMLPSAAPMILLYARTATGSGVTASPPTGVFLCGYLLVWGLFSLAAVLLQMLLERAGLVAGMEMASVSRPLSAALLVMAGLYQLSPLKDVCLRHCRSPGRFLSRHYRPGQSGALRMGMLHGAFCAGCCWLLMALLFVGGVMNLIWIAFLTLIVAAEKLLPGGRTIAVAGGILCLAWGAVIALS